MKVSSMCVCLYVHAHSETETDCAQALNSPDTTQEKETSNAVKGKPRHHPHVRRH